MKTIVHINSGKIGSTGKIMKSISDLALENNFKSYTATRKDLSDYSKWENHIYIGSILGKKIHGWLGYFTGYKGFFSVIDTKKFICKLDKMGVDIIHLHNLHSNFINYKILFTYLKKNPQIKVIWTLHDCWAFTGHCPYFDIVKCNKWLAGCCGCPSYTKYPPTFQDKADKIYKLKKELFTGIKNMTLVTPSNWLKKLVEKSFLGTYNCMVINNGIDLTVFSPTNQNFREKYALQKKRVLLGVSFSWGYRKGLDIFARLAEILDDSFQIVLVGIPEKLHNTLPSSIILIDRTSDQYELADIYSSADIFINPTREENFPTVNLESLACGTPIITFNTGGSPESINNDCGVVLHSEDLSELINAIETLLKKEKIKEHCLSQSKKYDYNSKLSEYITLYNQK